MWNLAGTRKENNIRFFVAQHNSFVANNDGLVPTTWSLYVAWTNSYRYDHECFVVGVDDKNHNILLSSVPFHFGTLEKKVDRQINREWALGEFSFRNLFTDESFTVLKLI